MNKGKLYGVGVGPGDPELITLKAVRLILENDFIAVPITKAGQSGVDSAAYKIAVSAIPEISCKTVVPILMPMTTDIESIKSKHMDAVVRIKSVLDRGLNLVFLILGDPTIYSTIMYLQAIISSDGYDTELVSGVPSFCAAAAKLGVPLVEWDETLHIVPGAKAKSVDFNQDDNFVIMKLGSHLQEVKRQFTANKMCVMAVSNCGMPNETICRNTDDIQDDSGYFTLIVAKKRNNR